MALSSPTQIAEKGEEIYRNKYQAEFEHKYPGKFVAIEINTGKAFLADTAEEAIKLAQQIRDGGTFHLIKVGAEGVYRVSYYGGWDWLS